MEKLFPSILYKFELFFCLNSNLQYYFYSLFYALITGMDKGKEKKQKENPITIQVLGGRNLASRDPNGMSDPYCLIGKFKMKYYIKITKRIL